MSMPEKFEWNFAAVSAVAWMLMAGFFVFFGGVAFNTYFLGSMIIGQVWMAAIWIVKSGK